MRSGIGQGKERCGGGKTGRRHRLRLPGLLAIIPFLLLSLVVPGTMLARDGQGGVTMVLCTEGGMVEMVVGGDGGLTEKPLHDGHGTDSHAPCHWAPHGQQLLDMAGPALAAPVPVPVAPVFAGERPEHLRRADVPAPLARGPPAHV